MKQMLDKFPKQEKNNNEEQKQEQEEEPIYESRKLLIRQMQGMIAKEVLKDRKGGTVGMTLKQLDKADSKWASGGSRVLGQSAQP